MRTKVDGIEEDLSTDGVRYTCRCSDVHNCSYCVRSESTGHQPRCGRYQRDQIVGVKVPIVAHLPPDNLRPISFQRQPGGYVGFMVHVGDHDLVTSAERLAD